jgi:hypothetical protein
MTLDTSTLVVQLVLVTAIISLPGFIGGVRVRFVPLSLKNKLPDTWRSATGPKSFIHGSGTTFSLPRAGFIQILSPGKPGASPCKSGQLKKDLELEASSARHAARLIIFEIMIWI